MHYPSSEGCTIDDQNNISTHEDDGEALEPSYNGQSAPDSDAHVQPTSQQGAPEPPKRYNPQDQSHQSQPVYYQPPQNSGPLPNGSDEFYSVKQQITIAQACALISLLIGGVLLSSVSVIIAVMAYRKVSGRAVYQSTDKPMWEALQKTARMAIVIALIALALNAVTLIVMYPTMMEVVQSADYGSLFGGAQQAAPTGGTGASTWG